MIQPIFACNSSKVGNRSAKSLSKAKAGWPRRVSNGWIAIPPISDATGDDVFGQVYIGVQHSPRGVESLEPGVWFMPCKDIICHTYYTSCIVSSLFKATHLPVQQWHLPGFPVFFFFMDHLLDALLTHFQGLQSLLIFFISSCWKWILQALVLGWKHLIWRMFLDPGWFGRGAYNKVIIWYSMIVSINLPIKKTMPNS